MQITSQSSIDQNQFQNQFQTVLLILGMVAILGLTGFLMFGLFGLLGAIGLLCIGLIVSGRATAAVVLGMYKASPIARHEAPQLVDVFHEICVRAELSSQPRLYYVPSRMPNAFAVGTGKTVSKDLWSSSNYSNRSNQNSKSPVHPDGFKPLVNGSAAVLDTMLSQVCGTNS